MTWFLCIFIIIGNERIGSGEILMKDKESCLRMASNLKPVPNVITYCSNYKIKFQ